MPLSYFRRPLAMATLAYILLLAFLKSRGFFQIPIPEDLNLPRAAIMRGAVISGFSPKKLGDRVWLRVDQIDGISRAPLRVMTYLPRGDSGADLERNIRPGQIVRLRGRLRAPRWPRNPGEFDEREFLAERGAALVLHADRLDILQNRVPWFWRPWAAAESAHRALHGYLYARFSSTTAALLEGFLLGYKGPLPKELNRSIQDAGVMHLLVPSGAKVAFVLAFALFLSSRFGLAYAWRFLVASALGGFYVLMVGAEPPYTRAYFVALALYATRMLDRESGNFSGVTLSAALTLMLQPRALFSAGFQMTYLAVLGLLIAMPRWKLPRAWPVGLRSAAYVLMASFVVQLMLWPIFASRFGRGSVAGLAANVLLVPASGLVMAMGFLCWALSWLPTGFPEALAVAAAKGLVACFAHICAFFAALPAAAWDLAPMTMMELGAFYLAALGLLLAPQWRPAAAAWAMAAAVGLSSWVWAGTRPPRVRAVFLGQGGARSVLITSPEGKNILVDTGVRPAVLKDVFRVLRVKRLEAVWVTAWDPFHCKTLGRLADLVQVGEVRLLPETTLHGLEEASPRCAASGSDMKVFRSGQNLSWPGGGLSVQEGPSRNLDIELKQGRFHLDLGRNLSRAWLVPRPGSVIGPEQEDYCIMKFPSKYRRPNCAAERLFFIQKDGAVTVYSDGEYLEIETQRKPVSLGRAVL